MNRIRKRFILEAMAAVAVSLVILLGLINVTLLTLAADDADLLTRAIADNRGFLGRGRNAGGLRFDNGRPVDGSLGRESPDMQASLRYFTFVFDKEGTATAVAYSMDSVTADEAAAWAQSLLKEKDVGWTARTYRYRIWKSDGSTYVTVIDQGRELLSFYRVLMISVIGFVIFLLASFAVLLAFSKRLTKPLETAERERTKLAEDIRQSFQIPLTVMNAGIDNLEHSLGTSEESQLLRRQLSRMNATVRALHSSNAQGDNSVGFSLKDMIGECARGYADRFAERGIGLETDVPETIRLKTDPEALKSVLDELLTNAGRFAQGQVCVTAKQEGERVYIEMSNGTDLPDGDYARAFDRYVRLDNADGIPGNGVGLNRVREQVRAMNGRIAANAQAGRFTLRISL